MDINDKKIKKKYIDEIIFNEDDIIGIEVKNINYTKTHEILIVLSGFYNDINNNKNEIYERIINIEKKIN